MSKRATARTSARRCCPDVGRLMKPGLFKALCDPNRIAILARLARLGRPCTVTKVAECCPVNISVVSRHLGLLRDAGVLEAEKRGKEVYYTVRYTQLAATLRAVADAIETCCPDGNPAECHVRKRKRP